MLHVLAQVLVCKWAVSTTSMTRSSVPQVSPVVDLGVEINGDPIMRHFVDLFIHPIDIIFYPSPETKQPPKSELSIKVFIILLLFEGT